MNCGVRRLKQVKATDGEFVSQATFKVLDYDKYVRFTVRGENGTWAHTNAYFVNDLLK